MTSPPRAGFVLQRQGAPTEVRPASDLFTHVLNTYPSGKTQDVLYFRGLFDVSRRDESAHSALPCPLTDLRTIFPLDVGARRAVTFVLAEPGKAGPPLSLELTVAGRETLQIGSLPVRRARRAQPHPRLPPARYSRNTPTSTRRISASCSGAASTMAAGGETSVLFESIQLLARPIAAVETARPRLPILQIRIAVAVSSI